jgi:hypothetical protein
MRRTLGVGRNSTDVSLHQDLAVLEKFNKHRARFVEKRWRIVVRGGVLLFMSVSQWKVQHVFGRKERSLEAVSKWTLILVTKIQGRLGFSLQLLTPSEQEKGDDQTIALFLNQW